MNKTNNTQVTLIILENTKIKIKGNNIECRKYIQTKEKRIKHIWYIIIAPSFITIILASDLKIK